MMLRYALLHPQLIAGLARTGHGSRILVADGNYAHATNVHPRTELVFLNLRPGLIATDDVLETLQTAIPIEAAHVMLPEDGSTPPVWARYRELLGADLPLKPLGRFDFYDTCRQDDLALCIASGDQRPFANLLLTVGVVPPD
jgi:L-fucose mutarotase